MKVRHIVDNPVNPTVKQVQNSAAAIYGELLKHLNKWPLEEGREDRSLKHLLLPRLQNELDTIERSTDVSEILNLGNKGQRELQAVIDLMTNTAFKKHKLDMEYLFPDAVHKEKTLLSTATKIKVAKKRYGSLDRFLAWYLSDSTTKAKEHQDNLDSTDSLPRK